MKIVYIHTDPFPSPMAGSVFALSTASGIARAGHDAFLFMPSARQTVDQALSYYNLPVPKNLRIELPAPLKVGLGPVRFTYTPHFHRVVTKRLLALKNVDGVIVRTLKLAAHLVKQDLPFPVIYEMHDWYGDVEQKWRGSESMISAQKMRHEKSLEAMHRDTVQKVDGLIALRNATAKVVRDRNPGCPVAVIPTGLELLPTLPDVSADPVVTYLGQLHPHKGLDVLFEAAVLAPRLHFRIIGGGKWQPHWERVAQEKGVSERMTFVGHVPKAEVPAQLAKARVGVLPLLDCFYNRHLTSPVKIMDYFAAGLPVVTVDAPVTSEMVEHEKTGLLTPFEDPPALAQALERMCFSSDLHEICRNNIALRLPDWTWTKRGEKIAAFIKSVK
jgi:glycosyltransferase involved in cell wall biosynthesis